MASAKTALGKESDRTVWLKRGITEVSGTICFDKKKKREKKKTKTNITDKEDKNVSITLILKLPICYWS